MKKITILLISFIFSVSGLAAQWLNVAERGARTDGTVVATGIIQTAIDEAAAAGGGWSIFRRGLT